MANQCHLRATLGESEPCTEERCPLWEDEGCAVERLGLQAAEPDVAAFLLDLRERLEAAAVDLPGDVRSEFARRLGNE